MAAGIHVPAAHLPVAVGEPDEAPVGRKAVVGHHGLAEEDAPVVPCLV